MAFRPVSYSYSLAHVTYKEFEVTDTFVNQIERSEAKSISMSRTVIAVVLSIVSGLFFMLAFPPFNIWLLMFVALVPYLVAQNRLLPSRWSHVAPTIAMAVWLWPFLYRIFNIDGAPIWLLHMGLLVAVLTFFTSSERKFNELTGYRWFILQGMAAWVGFEAIRSFIPVLGTMGFAANPLAGQAWLIQPVSIFSIYGLNLLVILVNFALAQLIMMWIDSKWAFEDSVHVDGKTTRRWALGTLLVVGGWVALSLVLYNQPVDAPTVRVAALHMDLKDPGHQVDEAEQAARLETFTQLAYQAAEEGAQVIYVPEMAFGFDPQVAHTAEVQAVAAGTNAYIYFTYAYHDDAGWHNETVLVSPDGTFSPIYGKNHAFGEPPTVSAGAFPINQTSVGQLGSIICMDGVFTDVARIIAGEGAQIMAIPSYDTTVGISEQNWTHFVFRSVENQVPVVNADRGFYSMITGSHGEILTDVRTPDGSNQVIVADVQLSDGNPPLYNRLGDWLGYVSLAGFVFFMVFQGRVEKQAKQAQKEQ